MRAVEQGRRGCGGWGGGLCIGVEFDLFFFSAAHWVAEQRCLVCVHTRARAHTHTHTHSSQCLFRSGGGADALWGPQMGGGHAIAALGCSRRRRRVRGESLCVASFPRLLPFNSKLALFTRVINTHTHTHAHTHARTHTHSHTPSPRPVLAAATNVRRSTLARRSTSTPAVLR